MQNIKQDEVAEYQRCVETMLHAAKRAGATAAEVGAGLTTGFSVQVRMGEVETVEFNRDKSIGLTVYFGQRKASASTSDTRPEAIEEAVKAACHIARYTQDDPCAGLADANLMATDYPDLDLNHPWALSPEAAIEQAKQCEAAGRAVDPRITNSEGASVSTHQHLAFYGNSHGFMGSCLSTRHGVGCSLIAQDQKGMQRDYAHTTARASEHLVSAEEIGREAGKKALSRLDARGLKTQQAPVLFAHEISPGLIGQFIAAIKGGNLYRKASFLVDHLGKKIFPDHLTIIERPHIKGALGSSPFDAEGVRLQDRVWIEQGILKSYILSSYSARQLGMQTTGNAGGVHNVELKTPRFSFDELLQKMDTGLIVTEVIGQGINLVTGDYSRGASGFWVERGEIQYPVEEITIAGNLRDMFQQIVAVGSDINRNSTIDTGSILIENMTIAGG